MKQIKCKDIRHPIQPLVWDKHKVLRFKQNKIVRYLLDNGGIDLNQIAILGFSKEDQEQFAQLIGYSVGGFFDLDYVSRKTKYKVELMEIDKIGKWEPSK